MTTRKFLRFLMYTLVVLCALGCVRVVEIGHPERIPILVFYTCVWLCIGLGIHLVLDKWSDALDRVQPASAGAGAISAPSAIRPPNLETNPATGCVMLDELTDVRGNPYGANWYG